MPRVRGIGGVFFKSENPEALRAWYAKHLGIESDKYGGSIPNGDVSTVWSVFPATTKYFDPGKASFMLNYIVDDLHSTLNELRGAGVVTDDKTEESEFGKFGWIADLDGNRIELWEPKPALPAVSA